MANIEAEIQKLVQHAENAVSTVCRWAEDS